MSERTVVNRMRFDSPVPGAFVISLLLSAVAILGSDTLNRDGMLYASIAQVILEDGMASALARFDWLVMPALMAGLSWLTGISTELSGYLLGAVLMAGACALAVACVQRIVPGGGWLATLVVLGMPAINAMRDQIVREFGYWFLCLLALWWALRWTERYRWREAILAQVSIAAAMAFRLEAVFLYPALIAWQLTARGDRPRAVRLAMVGIGPILALIVLAGLHAAGVLALETRLTAYLEAIDLSSKVGDFDALAGLLADAENFRFSRNDAPTVLFVGLVSLIPIKFIALMGVFVVPFGYLFASGALRANLARWAPFGWVGAVYAVVLVAFVTKYFFVTGRYVSFLDLLAAPLVVAGFVQLRERWRRVFALVVVLGIVTAVSNVVSLSTAKTDVVEAGRWVARQAPGLDRVAFQDQRIAYYAGAGYWPWIGFEREQALARLRAGGLDYVVLVLGPARADDDVAHLRASGLTVASRFERANGVMTVVLARAAH